MYSYCLSRPYTSLSLHVPHSKGKSGGLSPISTHDPRHASIPPLIVTVLPRGNLRDPIACSETKRLRPLFLPLFIYISCDHYHTLLRSRLIVIRHDSNCTRAPLALTENVNIVSSLNGRIRVSCPCVIRDPTLENVCLLP